MQNNRNRRYRVSKAKKSYNLQNLSLKNDIIRSRDSELLCSGSLDKKIEFPHLYEEESALIVQIHSIKMNKKCEVNEELARASYTDEVKIDLSTLSDSQLYKKLKECKLDLPVTDATRQLALSLLQKKIGNKEKLGEETMSQHIKSYNKEITELFDHTLNRTFLQEKMNEFNEKVLSANDVQQVSFKHQLKNNLSPKIHRDECSNYLLLDEEKASAIIFIDELDAIDNKSFDNEKSDKREVQRIMLELLNQLDDCEVNEELTHCTNEVKNDLSTLSDSQLYKKLKEYKLDLPVTEATRELALSLLQKKIEDKNSSKHQLKNKLSPKNHRNECYNYLLLDPRITKNLSSQVKMRSLKSLFYDFISAIFYIGKGTGSRSYDHLKEARLVRNAKGKKSRKIEKILEIFSEGLEVVVVQCFHCRSDSESKLIECLMIQAIGISNLTNEIQPKKRTLPFYSLKWNDVTQRRFGSFLLYQAFQRYLSEGKKQLKEHFIKS